MHCKVTCFEFILKLRAFSAVGADLAAFFSLCTLQSLAQGRSQS